MNMSNNYVGELQEFEVAHGGQIPDYQKQHGKGASWTATVTLSNGAAYASTTSYAKYGHAKNDAAYVALCNERQSSRKNALLRIAAEEDVEYIVLNTVPLRRVLEDVLATKTNRRVRMVWGDDEFDRICAFASIMRTLNIVFEHNQRSNESRVFC